MRQRKSTAAIDRAIERAVELGEQGLQLAVYLGEDLVIDTWTEGFSHPETGRAYDETTLYPAFSVTKAIAALCLHLQAERGFVDYDEPVARYWPEFAQAGKGGITVRHVLMHQSGVPQMPFGVTPELMGDWDWMVERLARATPVHAPGAGSAYQGLNFGWLVGEIVRRTDPPGRDFKDYIREELCAPLGVEDLWVGLPESEFHRVAHLESELNEGPVPGEIWASRQAKPFAVQPQAGVHNDPVVWAGTSPGAGGIMTAAAVARIFAMIANGGRLDGVRLLSEERVWGFTQPRWNPHFLDQVVVGGNRASMNLGMGAFHLKDQNFGGGFSFLSHSGQGRSVAFAHLDTKLSGAVCHNRMFEPHESGFDAFELLGPAVLDLAPGSTASDGTARQGSAAPLEVATGVM